MAFLLPVPNGNPWPKSWAIQLPFIGNNLSNPRPSKYQQSVKLAYSRDIRTFRKYYNKNVSQVVCSGIAMPRVVSSRCKLIKTLELYDHSQVRSSLHNLKCLKVGQITQKKVPINTIKRLVRYNKNLKEVWVDQNETMKFIASTMKCPRQLLTFSIGLCNLSKDKMRDGMKFLNRHRKLKEIALCSTAPPATQQRSINKESEAFAHLLSSLFKKNSLKAMKLDVADSDIVHNKHLLENFLLKRVQALESFDIRLALTRLPLLNQVVQDILGNIDYFALSIDGSPFHKANFWAEEILKRQQNSKRRLMVDFRGLNELDLNPMLSHISPNLRVLDISLNNNTSTISCAWDHVLSQLQCLQSLSISFSNCSEILANTLNQISPSVNCLPGLKYTAINLENIEFSPEIYQAIDHFYLAIQDIPEHSFGLQDSVHAGVQLDTLCQAVKHLNNLRFLKFMVYLRNMTDVDCVGKVVSDMHGLEKLNLHIRLDTHETMPFDLSLDNLTKLDHLRIELGFRPPEGFIEQLNMGISQLSALEHLELNILYYSKIRYPMFKSLLSRLNTLKALKDLEMSVNVEDENINESLSQKNFKLKREFNDLLQKHPALTRIMYHHFVSYICCTK